LTGLYVGRILVESKGRPTYIVDQIVSGGTADAASRRSVEPSMAMGDRI
jgi:hypothetical protein